MVFGSIFESFLPEEGENIFSTIENDPGPLILKIERAPFPGVAMAHMVDSVIMAAKLAKSDLGE